MGEFAGAEGGYDGTEIGMHGVIFTKNQLKKSKKKLYGSIVDYV